MRPRSEAILSILPNNPTRPKSTKIVLLPYLGLAQSRAPIKDKVTAPYISNSIVVIASMISCDPSFRSSVLALSTTVTAPPTATKTPQKSRKRNLSFSMNGAITQFEISATTPNGDTIDAGAKPYARKFPASPIVIRTIPPHQYGDFKYEDSPSWSSSELFDVFESADWNDFVKSSVPALFRCPSPSSCASVPYPESRSGLFDFSRLSTFSRCNLMCAYRCMFRAKDIKMLPTIAVTMPMKELHLCS